MADYRHVKDAKLREAEGIFLVEGRLGVRRLLHSERFRTRSVFVTETALRALEADLPKLGAATPVFVADQGVMNRIVGFAMHRGCLAAGIREGLPDFRALLDSLASSRRLISVLEEVANPENVGSVFRNTLAFGGDAVLLSEGCADPLYRKAIRVSMGATLRLLFARTPGWPELAQALRSSGFRIVALSTSRSAEDIAEYVAREAHPPRVALLVGGEGDGLSACALSNADASVRIPMVEAIDSLNVATATGIALHRFSRLGASERNDPRGGCRGGTVQDRQGGRRG